MELKKLWDIVTAMWVGPINIINGNVPKLSKIFWSILGVGCRNSCRQTFLKERNHFFNTL
jgi:hypothetical protein